MAATTTIRLPPKLRARIGKLAKQTGRSAHSLILEAVERHVDSKTRCAAWCRRHWRQNADIEKTGERVYGAEKRFTLRWMKRLAAGGPWRHDRNHGAGSLFRAFLARSTSSAAFQFLHDKNPLLAGRDSCCSDPIRSRQPYCASAHWPPHRRGPAGAGDFLRTVRLRGAVIVFVISQDQVPANIGHFANELKTGLSALSAPFTQSLDLEEREVPLQELRRGRGHRPETQLSWRKKPCMFPSGNTNSE